MPFSIDDQSPSPSAVELNSLLHQSPHRPSGLLMPLSGSGNLTLVPTAQPLPPKKRYLCEYPNLKQRGGNVGIQEVQASHQTSHAQHDERLVGTNQPSALNVSSPNVFSQLLEGHINPSDGGANSPAGGKAEYKNSIIAMNPFSKTLLFSSDSPAGSSKPNVPKEIPDRGSHHQQKKRRRNADLASELCSVSATKQTRKFTVALSEGYNARGIGSKQPNIKENGALSTHVHNAPSKLQNDIRSLIKDIHQVTDIWIHLYPDMEKISNMRKEGEFAKKLLKDREDPAYETRPGYKRGFKSEYMDFIRSHRLFLTYPAARECLDTFCSLPEYDTERWVNELKLRIERSS